MYKIRIRMLDDYNLPSEIDISTQRWHVLMRQNHDFSHNNSSHMPICSTLLDNISSQITIFNLAKKSKVITSPPEGVARYCFHPVLSVCLSVCVSVCPADILVFYFSAIIRDIDLKFIQDTYRPGAQGYSVPWSDCPADILAMLA